MIAKKFDNECTEIIKIDNIIVMVNVFESFKKKKYKDAVGPKH